MYEQSAKEPSEDENQAWGTGGGANARNLILKVALLEAEGIRELENCFRDDVRQSREYEQAGAFWESGIPFSRFCIVQLFPPLLRSSFPLKYGCEEQ